MTGGIQKKGDTTVRMAALIAICKTKLVSGASADATIRVMML